jgi:hypothetical protein
MSITPCRTRTYDYQLRRLVLYPTELRGLKTRLSQMACCASNFPTELRGSPLCKERYMDHKMTSVRPAGIEPATPGSEVQCSIR